MNILFNDPGFDPNAPRQAVQPPRRGNVVRALMLMGGVGLLGSVAAEWWFKGHIYGERAEAAPDVQPITARMVDIQPVKAEELPTVPPPTPRSEPASRLRTARQEPRQEPKTIQFALNAPEPPKSLMLDGIVPNEGLGCTLRPGANGIHAALTGVVRSEIGGEAHAVVTEDVFDADGYGQLLIPAGSKLVGLYKTNGNLRLNDQRIPFVWQTITTPEGFDQRQIVLGDASGLDAAGSMGVGGEVRTHWGKVIAAAALFTIFDVGQRGVFSDDNSFSDDLQRSATRNFGRTGAEVTRQMLSLEPEITVPSGTPILVSIRRPVKVSPNCFDG
jgi:type IV secretory pathway VirB10-like protein